MKILINISEMSQKLSQLYSDGTIDKGLFKSLSLHLLNGQYKTVAIYLYKRVYMSISRNDLHNCIVSLFAQGSLKSDLYLSFRKKTDYHHHVATMYVIKNDHIKYIDSNMNIKEDPISERKLIENKEIW